MIESGETESERQKESERERWIERDGERAREREREQQMPSKETSAYPGYPSGGRRMMSKDIRTVMKFLKHGSALHN